MNGAYPQEATVKNRLSPQKALASSETLHIVALANQ